MPYKCLINASESCDLSVHCITTPKKCQAPPKQKYTEAGTYKTRFMISYNNNVISLYN